MLKPNLAYQNKNKWPHVALVMACLCFSVGISLSAILLHPSLAQAASPNATPTSQNPSAHWWNFQAIDTMKFSRDPSKQFLSNPTQFNQVVEEQVKNIAATGVTHIAIATPYDEEFLPILSQWVAVARRYNLHIWFRGNWSGWEGWFGYARITRQDHLQKTVTFIKAHPELFEDGDVFSACPECENGGPGDPRLNNDAAGHRKFLIDEYQAMGAAFRDINRNVQVNFNSMNGDVARLIMDKPTTQALGGIIVIDHYVRTPDRLNRDITDFAQRSGGKVILGEYGAPIPDIHGQMTEDQQAAWIKDSLHLLAANPALMGLSYWTNVGGSTAIWNDNGTPKKAVSVLQSYYSPQTITGTVHNTLDQAIGSGLVETDAKAISINDGQFSLPYLDADGQVTITAPGYVSQQTTITELTKNPHLQLVPTTPNLWYKLQQWFRKFIPLSSHATP